MRDTFTKVFPAYTHAQPSVFKFYKPTSQEVYVYKERGEDGKPIHLIDRQHTRKKYFMKTYHEKMISITALQRAKALAAKAN